MRILFVGNSHTAVNDVPGMVKSLIESDGHGRTASVDTILAAHLNDIGDDAGALARIQSGNWDVIVLQGALVSMSHKYTYPQDGGIKLAKIAKSAGARVLCYSEWSRRDIDETIYTEDVYREIATAAGGEVVPAGRVWDAVRKRNGGADYWQMDGNHALPAGSLIAAEAIYTWILGTEAGDPTWFPGGVDPKVGRDALEESRLLNVKGIGKPKAPQNVEPPSADSKKPSARNIALG